MGKRAVPAVIGLLAVLSLSAGVVPIEASQQAATRHSSIAPIQWQPTYDIDPATADKLIAETPRGVALPDKTSARWDCHLPMSINYSVAPGVDRANLLRQMAYSVRYLNGLGYYAAVGYEVPYEINAPMPAMPGSVLVIATPDRSEQSGLAGKTYRGYAQWAGETSKESERGLVTLMSTNGMSSDVILHEIGHILGLEHKDGTVMTATAVSGLGFDAAETAAIDCRG
jgi:hypothetical protein